MKHRHSLATLFLMIAVVAGVIRLVQFSLAVTHPPRPGLSSSESERFLESLSQRPTP